MRSHLRQVTKKKVSDFLLREEGMIGSRTGFATAAMVSTTALAMTLLLAPDAAAEKWCGGPNKYCWDHEICCWNKAQGNNAVYTCGNVKKAGWNCW